MVGFYISTRLDADPSSWEDSLSNRLWLVHSMPGSTSHGRLFAYMATVTGTNLKSGKVNHAKATVGIDL